MIREKKSILVRKFLSNYKEIENNFEGFYDWLIYLGILFEVIKYLLYIFGDFKY